MASKDKPLVWLHGEVKSPPFSRAARLETGFLLRRLQQGEGLGLPHSRPMSALGARCHELRVRDADHSWRIFYRTDADAVLILGLLDKKTQRIPGDLLQTCRERADRYDRDAQGKRR